MNTLTTRIQLNNGTAIPCLGFGTYKIKDPAEAYNSVRSALEAGYRHIDTAAFYENAHGWYCRASRLTILSKTQMQDRMERS